MTHIGPYPLNSIITGDARELSKAMPDESVDLIFTDPVYDRIEDYAWLAKEAARVLKPNSACLVWVGTDMIDKVTSKMADLSFSWVFVMQRIGGNSFARNGRLVSKFEVCLWYEKGNSKPNTFIWDFQQSAHWPRFHKTGWDKPPAVISRWLDAFTRSSAIVYDPFTGGGTVPAVCKMLQRDYIAFEIDPETADMARERVANTQPPLPLVMPEQLSLDGYYE